LAFRKEPTESLPLVVLSQYRTKNTATEVCCMFPWKLGIPLRTFFWKLPVKVSRLLKLEVLWTSSLLSLLNFLVATIRLLSLLLVKRVSKLTWKSLRPCKLIGLFQWPKGTLLALLLRRLVFQKNEAGRMAETL